MTTWRILLVPLVIAVFISAGWAVSYSGNNALSGIGWFTLALVGYCSYMYGSFVLYSAACRKLGYTCELNPSHAPRSAHQSASFLLQFVITGTFHSRSFTLYREIERGSPGFKGVPAAYTVVEWAGGEIQPPTFTLRVSALNLANKISAALLRNTRFGLEPGSDLTTRIRLSGPGAQTARSLFTPAVCDQLAGILSDATISGESGLLVTRETAASSMPWRRQGKFPLPWQIEGYLARAERIRNLLGY
jgi:hypothetical protein